MAMNGDLLGMAIADAITDADASPEAKQAVLAIWQKIGNEIINHITTNAMVPAGIAVSTTGSPTAQTGATTSPGSII
jgi:predicted XRE-type DNA-binding protein